MYVNKFFWLGMASLSIINNNNGRINAEISEMFAKIMFLLNTFM